MIIKAICCACGAEAVSLPELTQIQVETLCIQPLHWSECATCSFFGLLSCWRSVTLRYCEGESMLHAQLVSTGKLSKEQVSTTEKNKKYSKQTQAWSESMLCA